jgi:hypothetical protein
MAAKTKTMSSTTYQIVIGILLLAVVILSYKLYVTMQAQQGMPSTSLSLQEMTYDPTPEMIGKSTDGEKLFKHPELGYSVDIPSGWTPRIYRTLAGAAVQPYEDVIFLSPDYEQTPSNVYVPIIAKGASIFIRGAETVYKSTQERFDNNPIAKRIAQNVQSVTVDGIPALQYDYTLNGENVTNITFVTGGKWYLIKYQYADDDAKEQYLSAFQQVEKSFRLR